MKPSCAFAAALLLLCCSMLISGCDARKSPNHRRSPPPRHRRSPPRKLKSPPPSNPPPILARPDEPPAPSVPYLINLRLWGTSYIPDVITPGPNLVDRTANVSQDVATIFSRYCQVDPAMINVRYVLKDNIQLYTGRYGSSGSKDVKLPGTLVIFSTDGCRADFGPAFAQNFTVTNCRTLLSDTLNVYPFYFDKYNAIDCSITFTAV